MKHNTFLNFMFLHETECIYELRIIFLRETERIYELRIILCMKPKVFMNFV
jgi:hypothetical protein